jgi:hypothetical protein
VNPFRSVVRSTLGLSRRAVGLPLVLERLAQLENKLTRFDQAGTRLDRLEQLEAKLERVTNELVARGTNILPWHACTYEAVLGHARSPEGVPGAVPLRSTLCTQGDFVLDAYRYWMRALNRTPRFHRKEWELFFVTQALHERGKLGLGRRGLGFGVGQEPLPALFAAHGCDVLATDQGEVEAVRAGWAQTGQHATDVSTFNKDGICDDALLQERVTFRCIDMNAIPDDLSEEFDFCWSTCSFEHLGSLEHGKVFVENSIRTLKPGGVAIHTTEFNLSSNSDTIESRDLSIYRRRDIEDLVERLHRTGCHVEPIEWEPQTGFIDKYVDLPPYREAPHLRLRLGSYDCTSIGLIITKP